MSNDRVTFRDNTIEIALSGATLGEYNLKEFLQIEDASESPKEYAEMQTMPFDMPDGQYAVLFDNHDTPNPLTRFIVKKGEQVTIDMIEGFLSQQFKNFNCKDMYPEECIVDVTDMTIMVYCGS